MNGQIDLRDRWDKEHLAVLIMCLFLAWDFRILTWQSPTKEKVSLLQSKLGFYEWEGWKVFSEVTMPRLHKFFQKSLHPTTLNGCLLIWEQSVAFVKILTLVHFRRWSSMVFLKNLKWSSTVKKWSSTVKSEVQHQKVKFNTKKSEVQHLYKIGVKLIVRNSIFYTIPESLM